MALVMGAQAQKTKLRLLRNSLLEPKVTQEDLARSAGLILQTYWNAESGKNITYTTANAIFLAINRELVARGRDQLESVHDLGCTIV